MTHINLLPWREHLREQKKKRFIFMLVGSASITIFIIVLMNYYTSKWVKDQTYRNEMLRKKINLLDDEFKEIKTLKQAIMSSNEH